MGKGGGQKRGYGRRRTKCFAEPMSMAGQLRYDYGHFSGFLTHSRAEELKELRGPFVFCVVSIGETEVDVIGSK